MTWFGPVSALGECPRWDERSQTLSWVDIDGGRLHLARPLAESWDSTSVQVGSPLAGAVATADGAGYVLSLGGDLVAWSHDTGLGARVGVLPREDATTLRLNETVTDPNGRIWVGSMAYDWTPGAGAFFVLEPDCRVRRVLSGFTITNGVGWSPDGAVMYTTETRPGCITAWDVAPGGDPVRPRALVTADGTDGSPDGLAIDAEGNIWSAFAGGGHVTSFSPEGAVLQRVEIDAPLVTSCCFAGTSRDRLIITTGTKRLDASTLTRHPGSGRVWDAGFVGAKGLPQQPVTTVPGRLPFAVAET